MNLRLEDWHNWNKRLEKFKEGVWSWSYEVEGEMRELKEMVNGLLDDWDSYHPGEDE